ncbi:hypothetical protein QT971_19950 [Microcoleus sp. herbarium19]|uniref:hypothetical protein n=1 Tax=unclassified Microcoleus TaxID=2642155 RepID=UPI002FD60318
MKAEFYFDHRTYTCSLVQADFVKELKIKNYQGYVLAVKQGQKIGLLGKTRHNAKKVDVSQSHFYNLIKAAMNALELQTRNDLILEKDRIIADGEKNIQQQDREIRVLNEQLRILAEKVEQLLESQQQLSMQLVNRIRENEVSPELDDSSAPEADFFPEETEKKIIQNTEQLAVEILDNQPLESETEGLEEAQISAINDESVDFQVGELEENRREVKIKADDSQIKRLPKTASNRRMKKKS